MSWASHVIKTGGKFWSSQSLLYFVPALSGNPSSHTGFVDYLSKEPNLSIRLVGNKYAYLWCCELSCWAVSNSEILWNCLTYISSWWTKMKGESIQVNNIKLLYFGAISRLKYKVAVLGMHNLCGWKYKKNSLGWWTISSLEIQLQWKLCHGQSHWKVGTVA